ncbi:MULTISPECIES: hypothetical protein [Marinobacter]|jgi:hypothetical protein|uniref:Uncharacterized protein n=1 Tax=Marinobacter vinifirmus TaxID=355591 RepID=A0A558B9E2_9GAMM|nr:MULTISPECIES: hypothetical protein [Marinobacter]ERS06314.1 hypothetical protein Q673_18035 [Marinobacter sp. EN3]TVT33136.1 MAG: hypothetical protein FHK81_09710 [Marinobacter vinifirmus]|tara:strand:- start:654 stop:1361 length:708 start_codon:yes stop_codon:yes gene_type:complete
MTDWLNEVIQKASSVAAWKDIATVLSGFSTLAIAVLTVFLWRENRLLRKGGSEPRLIAYYEPHPDGTGGLNIAITNVGKGPAKDVYFQFDGDPENFAKYDLVLDCSHRRGPIATIPQDGKISIFFAVGFQLFSPKSNGKSNANEPIDPFHILIEWQSMGGRKKYADRFLLDVKPYANLPGFINKPHLLKLVDSVNAVGKQIGTLKPEVGRLVNLIEANTLDSRAVRKVKGNPEDV